MKEDIVGEEMITVGRKHQYALSRTWDEKLPAVVGNIHENQNF